MAKKKANHGWQDFDGFEIKTSSVMIRVNPWLGVAVVFSVPLCLCSKAIFLSSAIAFEAADDWLEE